MFVFQALDDLSAPTKRFGLTDKEFSKLSLENKLILMQVNLIFFFQHDFLVT